MANRDWPVTDLTKAYIDGTLDAVSEDAVVANRDWPVADLWSACIDFLTYWRKRARKLERAERIPSTYPFRNIHSKRWEASEFLVMGEVLE